MNPGVPGIPRVMRSVTGDHETVEQRLVALMCSAAARRQSRAHEAGELLGSSRPERIIDLLRRLRITALVGQRLVNSFFDLDPPLRQEIELSTALGRQRGGAHELATQAILDSIEAAGIRALGLKGSVLARAPYDDVAWRSAGHIDVLVAVGDLAGAIDASLVDLLLAPPKGSTASLRRGLQKVPNDLQRSLTRKDDFAVHRARWEHGLRLLRRWELAIAPATVRAYRQGPDRGPIRSGG